MCAQPGTLGSRPSHACFGDGLRLPRRPSAEGMRCSAAPGEPGMTMEMSIILFPLPLLLRWRAASAPAVDGDGGGSGGMPGDGEGDGGTGGFSCVAVVLVPEGTALPAAAGVPPAATTAAAAAAAVTRGPPPCLTSLRVERARVSAPCKAAADMRALTKPTGVRRGYSIRSAPASPARRPSRRVPPQKTRAL